MKIDDHKKRCPRIIGNDLPSKLQQKLNTEQRILDLEKSVEKLRKSATIMYSCLWDLLENHKVTCDSEYSSDCTKCRIDQILNREGYLVEGK